MEAIKNIIFDLGGVILNIDFQRAADAFHKLGIKNFDLLYSQAVQSELFDKLERGHITADDFHREMRDLSGLDLSDTEIDAAWNALILDFPPARLQLLRQIRKHYKIFLLSNTNIIHADFYNNDLRENHGINGLEELFDRVYYSHAIGLRKPKPESFHHVLEKEHLRAGETLFIDDSRPNIEAAAKLGMKTLFIDLQKGDDVLDFFEAGILKK